MSRACSTFEAACSDWLNMAGAAYGDQRALGGPSMTRNVPLTCIMLIK
jgi:hypothetical protein